jgi:endonuclease YncB( thermonuclease family)
LSNRRTPLDAADDEGADLLALWIILGSLFFMAVILFFSLVYGSPANAEEAAARARAKAETRARALRINDLSWLRAPDRQVRVIDGDSIIVPISGGFAREINVRISGIDTPEVRGRCPEETALAQQTSDTLRTLSSGGVALISGLEFDRYGRLLGRIYDRQGRDLAEILVQRGLAKRYDGQGPRPTWCPPPTEGGGR